MKKTILFFILLVVLTSSIVAQPIDTVKSMAGIEITTSVDKADIYIGDLINYKVTIKYDSTFELIPPPLGANLGAFDVKDYQTDITTKLDDGRLQSENIFVLSTFTTGDYIIPPMPVIFTLPDSSYKALLSEGVPIKVKSLLFNTDDSLDIKPSKAQFEFQRDYTIYYYAGGAGLFLLLIISYLIWRHIRRKQDETEPVDNRPAWEIASEKMAMLKQKNYIADKRFKMYYIELSEIFRGFFDKQYQINVLDMTTTEFLEAMKVIDEIDQIYESTKKFLGHADLVKFARYTPETERAEADFDEVYRIIEFVKNEIIRKQAALTEIKIATASEDSTPQDEEVAS